jgi:hypothetical protein
MSHYNLTNSITGFFRHPICTLTVLSFLGSGVSEPAMAIDQASTVKAVRMANTITGGSLPIYSTYNPATQTYTYTPIFSKMVSQIAAGDLVGAAMTAMGPQTPAASLQGAQLPPSSNMYFTNYLAKRLAYEMQNDALNANNAQDCDGTAFLIAHFVGGPTWKPSLSTIWSENQTYVLDVPVGGVMTQVHAGVSSTKNPTTGAFEALYNPATVDWSSQLVQAGPQQAYSFAQQQANVNQFVPIPPAHVGGYTTASTTGVDNSFAYNASFLGTNLRFIEGIWEIATGLTIQQFEDVSFASTEADQAAAVPRFVPENNSNFFVGQGQPACIACHGGGLSALAHGYGTVADTFDFSNNIFKYNDLAATNYKFRKSLGSSLSPQVKQQVAACNLSKTPDALCNPDSSDNGTGALSTAWDLTSWQNNGMLARMGWTGPVKGDGLNQLGTAIGQAAIVYQFFTKRVINEICPMGMFTQDDLNAIAQAANPYNNTSTPGTDDIRTIVAMVAANPSCQ